MTTVNHDPGADDVVNVFNAGIERRGTSWCLVSLVDGRWKTLSKHPNRAAAERALVALNESGTRGRIRP